MSEMKTILLHNIYDEMNRDNAVFQANSRFNRDDHLLFLTHLKEELANRGYLLQTIDQGDVMICDYLLFFDIPSFMPALHQNHYFLHYLKQEKFKKKMLLVLWEPPVVYEQNWIFEYHQYFQTIFTWYDDVVDDNRYVKIFHPQPVRRYPPSAFSEKNFCTLINSNRSSSHPLELYSERRKAIRFFEHNHPEEFDLYGFAWDQAEYPSFRGTIQDKGEILSRYKYAICFENMRNANGYITEKIFDCFRAGCVPIYLGAPNITDHLPAGTFIDLRQFPNYEQLYAYLKQISEEHYQNYLKQIDHYLNSSLYEKQFSKEAFSRTVVEKIMALDR